MDPEAQASSEPFVVTKEEAVLKCFVTRSVLEKAKTFVSKGLFKTSENDTIAMMSTPKSFYALQSDNEVLMVAKVVGLEECFLQKPIVVDPLQCYELMTMSMQEDGVMVLTNANGEKVQVNVTTDMVRETGLKWHN